MFDARTLLSGNVEGPGISLSTDLGQTWTKVSDFSPLGHRPIHFGRKLLWAAREGVITTDNGRDWTLLGTKLEDATWGPYFGKSESEMMVVTPAGFFITKDAAKTWTHVAPYFAVPDGMAKGGYDKNTVGRYFAWDPEANVLYAGGLGGGAYRLKLK